jgi:hypothetical protein
MGDWGNGMHNLVAVAAPVKGRLDERLKNYFAHVPEASREQFLLEALQNEMDRREQQLNGGQPWPAARTRSFRPAPPPTLPSEAVHDWLCARLQMLEQTRPRSRSRLSRWFW